MSNIDSLQLLLDAALFESKHKSVQKEERVRAMKNASERRPNISTYSKPENWTATKVITLIHREIKAPNVMDTLLGNFQEYIHKSGARRLTRITEPRAAEATEYVSGDWWLNTERENAHVADRNGHWTKVYRYTIGIQLKELMLYSPDVPVIVTTYLNHIQMVELTSTVKFFSQDRKEFLLLHPGTDILECMSLDSKLDLRAQIQVEEESEDENG